MAKSSNTVSINFSGALLIAFIVLKLTKVIDWSWWWVMAPLWAPIILFILGFIFYFIVKKLIELK